MQRKAIFDAVRAAGGGFEKLGCDLDLIAGGKLELEAVKAKQDVEFVMFCHFRTDV